MILRANSLWNVANVISEWIDAWLLANSTLHYVPLATDFRPYETCPYITCRDGSRMYDVSSLDR